MFRLRKAFLIFSESVAWASCMLFPGLTVPLLNFL
jgi:hypothetical protein